MQKYYNYINEGVQKYLSKDFKGAILYFTDAINQNANKYAAYFFRANAYEDLGDVIAAQEDYIRALSLDPTNYVAAFRLGMICGNNKDFSKAVDYLEIAHKYCIPQVEAGDATNAYIEVSEKIILQNLGNYLIYLKQYQKAISILEKAIEIDENYSKVYLSKGIAYYELQQKHKALECLNEASYLGEEYADLLIEKITEECFNIIDDDEINQYHKIDDFSQAFVTDLLKNLGLLRNKNKFLNMVDITKSFVYYALDILTEYQKNSLNMLPKPIITQVKEQVLKALVQIFKELPQKEIFVKDYNIIFDEKILEPNVIVETKKYFELLYN